MSKAYIYAHLDENGICNGFCGPGNKRSGSYLVEVPEMDDCYIRKKYNAETGEWEEVEQEETEEPQPLSEQEQISIDMALNVEYLVCLMETSLT